MNTVCHSAKSMSVASRLAHFPSFLTDDGLWSFFPSVKSDFHFTTLDGFTWWSVQLEILGDHFEEHNIQHIPNKMDQAQKIQPFMGSVSVESFEEFAA